MNALNLWEPRNRRMRRDQELFLLTKPDTGARNISDAGVLAEIAAPHGFSAAETARIVGDPAELEATTAEAAEAAASGIGGVPFFVFDQRFAVSGAQQEEVLRAAIARATSTAEG